MDNVAWPPSENGVKLVLTRGRETLITPCLVAVKPPAVVPAPRPLRHVAGQGADVANLRRGHRTGRLRQHGKLVSNQLVPTESVECDQSTDPNTAPGRLNLVVPNHRLEAHHQVRFLDPLFDHAQQIASSAGVRRSGAGRAGHSRQGHRLTQRARVRVAQRLHVNASMILSRVIGRSFIRRPIALKMAFPTAAGASTIPDSPTYLAPNGP